MFLSLIIASLLNLYTLNNIVYEKINYYNRINAPLADFDGVLTAYNYSGQIPGTTTTCQNKLTCLQSMCELSRIPKCTSMKIWVSATWGQTSCNATIYDNLLLLKSDEWYGFIITIIVFSIISMLLSTITGICLGSNKNVKIAMILIIIMLNILSEIFIVSIIMSLISNVYHQPEYLIIGAKFVEFCYLLVELTIFALLQAMLYFHAMISYNEPRGEEPLYEVVS